MILEQINNSIICYNECFLYYAKDYYDYIVNIVKDCLYLHPEICKNVIIGDYEFIFNNYNPVTRININFEHTLVIPGGRDTHNSVQGVVPILGREAGEVRETYLVRIDNYDHLMKFDIIIDYSFPNLINIESCGLFTDYMNKCVCVSPLLHPIYNEKGDRKIQCLTTFINTEEPRRKRLLQQMPEHLHHRNINNCFERNSIIELYRDTKILINIHQTEHHHTSEELRILPALLAGVIVISEDSPLRENIPYHEYIIWVKYENIIELVENVQKNYDSFFSQIFQDGKLQSIFVNIEKINKYILQEHLIRMNTNFYDVPFGEFSENAVKTWHNAGFFSCCSVLLHLIVHYINTYKRLPTYLITDATFEWYKPPGQTERNIYPDYFLPNDELKIEYTGDIHYTENDQFTKFEIIEFEKLFPLVQKYFNPSEEIKQIIEDIERKYNIDYENTCALFLRGNDKSTECSIPEYDFYRSAANKILESNPDIRFMVQSDETEFINAITQEFPQSFYCKDEIRHINKSNTTVDVVYKNLNYEFSKKFLAITIIMSKCKHVVCNYGNCSIWIALFRNHIDNIIEYNVGK